MYHIHNERIDTIKMALVPTLIHNSVPINNGACTTFSLQTFSDTQEVEVSCDEPVFRHPGHPALAVPSVWQSLYSSKDLRGPGCCFIFLENF